MNLALLALALTTLPVPTGAAPRAPSLTAGDGGTVLLAWLEAAPHATPDATPRLVYAALGAPGFQAPSVVPADGRILANAADAPSVVALPNGGRAATWTVTTPHGGDSGLDVRAALQKRTSEPWVSLGTLTDEHAAVENGFATLLPGPLRLLVWLDGRKTAAGGSTTLRAVALGESGARQSVVDERVCDCCRMSAAALADGAAIVAYRGRTPDDVRDVYVRRHSATGWASPVLVHADGWKIDGCPVNGPAIAANGKTVWVAWFTAAGGTARVLAARSADGGVHFTAPVTVSDPGSAPLGRVQLVMDGTDALVAWVGASAPDGGAPWRIRRLAGTNARPPETLAEGIIGHPRLVLAGANVIAAWSTSGPKPDLKAARFATNAVK